MPIRSLLWRPRSPPQRTTVENNILRWAFLETSAPAQDREAWLKLAALRADKEKFERTLPTVMVMAGRARAARNAHARPRRLR